MVMTNLGLGIFVFCVAFLMGFFVGGTYNYKRKYQHKLETVLKAIVYFKGSLERSNKVISEIDKEFDLSITETLDTVTLTVKAKP